HFSGGGSRLATGASGKPITCASLGSPASSPASSGGATRLATGPSKGKEIASIGSAASTGADASIAPESLAPESKSGGSTGFDTHESPPNEAPAIPAATKSFFPLSTLRLG